MREFLKEDGFKNSATSPKRSQSKVCLREGGYDISNFSVVLKDFKQLYIIFINGRLKF